MTDRSRPLSARERVRRRITRIIVHSLNRVPLHISPPRGFVSFTFDDFPASAYRTGGEILKRYGVRGTYYAALSFLGGEWEGQRMMTEDDIAALLQDGHELGCHTYSHVSCRSLSRRQLEVELSENASRLSQVVGNAKFINFSYPFGDITLAAKRLGIRRFATCRGRRAGPNRDVIDLAALSSERIYSRFDSIEHTLGLIARNAKERGWLIFCTHDVAESPSPCGCRPEHLDAAVKAAVESGCNVLSIADAYSQLCDASA